MEPTNFDESNGVLDKPRELTYDDCDPLSVLHTVTETGFPVIVSCWKPTKEELLQIVKTGRVWLMVFGEGMPPVALYGIKPIRTNPEDLDPQRN